MAKIVIGAALIAAAIIFAPATPALLGLSFAFTAAETTMIATIGASFLLAGIASALQHNLGTSIAARQAAAPWTVVYGRSRIGGVIVYLSLTGSNDKFLQMVIVHASHTVQDIPTLYLDGKKVYVGGGGLDDGNTHYDDSGNAYNFHQHVYWEKRLGTATQTCFTYLNAADSNWPTTATLAGHACSYIRLQYDAQIFPNGIPGIRVDIIGKNDIYDPRTGTSGYSENAALCVNDVLCNTDYGLQCNYATEVDEAQLIAAANICDETVLIANGGSEARYSCNGTFTTDAAPGDILQQILTAMGGRMTWVGGVWKIYPAAWTAPSLTLSDSDLMGPIRWTPKRKYRDLINAVKATFVCPTFPYVSAGPGLSFGQKISGVFDGQWRQTDVPPYLQDVQHGYPSDANYAADGNTRLWHDTRFPFTISVATAQRLMKITLLRNRQQGTGMLSCRLNVYRAQALDVIQFSHSRFAWSNKLLEITNFRYSVVTDKSAPPALSIELDVQETDPSIYAWTTAEELGINDNPAPQLPNMSSVQAPSGLTLTSDASTAVAGADGIVRSRILVAWTAPTDGFVLHGGFIELQYQQGGQTTWYPFAQFDGATTTAYINGVNDGATYSVRIRAVNASGAYSDWVTATVTIGNLYSSVSALSTPAVLQVNGVYV